MSELFEPIYEVFDHFERLVKEPDERKTLHVFGSPKRQIQELIQQGKDGRLSLREAYGYRLAWEERALREITNYVTNKKTTRARLARANEAYRRALLGDKAGIADVDELQIRCETVTEVKRKWVEISMRYQA